jgi:hypothetical protein
MKSKMARVIGLHCSNHQIWSFALQLPEAAMSPLKDGRTPETHTIAQSFRSAFSTNLVAGMLRRFFSVKEKLLRLSSINPPVSS